MDPDSRANLDPNRWSTNKRVKARTKAYLGTPVLRAVGPKVVRPEKKQAPPPQPTESQLLLQSLLQLQRNRDEAAMKLAKRGYRTQTEHQFMKLRWPFHKKPLV